MKNWISGEFDHKGLRWVARLLSWPRPISKLRPPIAVWVLVTGGVFALLSSLMAKTCGLALITTFQFHPTGGKHVIENSHVFGFLGEANFGLWLLFGFPIFLWLLLWLLQRAATALIDLINAGRIIVHAGENASNLVPRWARSAWLGWFWLTLAAAASLWSFGFQIYEAQKAWTPPQSAEKFAAKDGFDFGNTQAPWLQWHVVDFFNLRLTPDQKLLALANNRPRWLSGAWRQYQEDEIEKNSGPKVTFPNQSPSWILIQIEEKKKLGESSPEITMRYERQSDLNGQHPVAYWCYLFLTYCLTGLGWAVAAWAIFKVGLIIFIVWIALRGGGGATFQVVPDYSRVDLGLGPLIRLSQPVLWLGIFGSLYVICMRSVPLVYTHFIGNKRVSEILHEGDGGFTHESLGIDWSLLIAFLIVAVVGLFAWYRAIAKLAADRAEKLQDQEHPIALHKWLQIVVLALALAFPLVMRGLEDFPALNDTMKLVAAPIREAPLGMKVVTRWLFNLTSHGPHSVE